MNFKDFFYSLLGLYILIGVFTFCARLSIAPPGKELPEAMAAGLFWPVYLWSVLP